MTQFKENKIGSKLSKFRITDNRLICKNVDRLSMLRRKNETFGRVVRLLGESSSIVSAALITSIPLLALTCAQAPKKQAPYRHAIKS
jgi:hypothetical protein